MADYDRPRRAQRGEEPGGRPRRASQLDSSDSYRAASQRAASVRAASSRSHGAAGRASGSDRGASLGRSRDTDSRSAAHKPSRRTNAAGSGGRGGSRRGRKGSRRGLLGRLVRGVLILGLAMILIGTVGAYVFYQQAKLPEPNADFLTQTSTLYFRDGTTQLGQLSVQNRTDLDYAEMPQIAKDAIVAAEDRTFWTNSGVDFKGMGRALVRIVQGKNVQSGSTITQQFIKIRYLTSDQTLTRKLTEVALAIKMNKAESKEAVLAGYLNTVYFGRGAYGIQAAAQAFFQVDAKDLSVGQAAVLASVVNSPSMFDPANGAEAQQRLLERYNYTLDGMLSPMGAITQAEHDQFYNHLPAFPEYRIDNVYGGPNGFLIQMATEELQARGFTETQIHGSGWNITTTFDARMQQAAIDAAQSVTAEAAENAAPLRDENGMLILDANGNAQQPDPSQLHVGLASIEVGTGAVLALYGGPDFVANSRNWATTPRYAASTYKVWGAVAGLRNGFGLSSMLEGDTYTPPGDMVPVHNDSGAQYGPITLQKAIHNSVNTAFVDMVSRIPEGNKAVIKAANDAGIPEHPSWQEQGDRLVLGEGEVSPLNNATGFATLANKGTRNETHVVAEVRDANGNVVYSGDTQGVRTIEDAVSRDLTYAMSGVMEASSVDAVDGRPVAGKTGTEGIASGQDGATRQITRAGWLVGYTRHIATAVVMVAGDTGNENLDAYAPPGWGTFYGAGYPTQVWNRYMAVAVAGTPYDAFDPPANIQPTVRDTASMSPETPTSAPTPETPTQPPSETATQPATSAVAPTNSGPAPSTTLVTQPPSEPPLQSSMPPGNPGTTVEGGDRPAEGGR